MLALKKNSLTLNIDMLQKMNDDDKKLHNCLCDKVTPLTVCMITH